MHISSITVVINEEDYIYYALKSVYDAVDSIIIVEGAARRRFGTNAVRDGYLTSEGLSGDGTQSEIQRLLREDTEKKITYIRSGWAGSVNELRQIALGSVPLDTDYCFVVDADALYLEEEIHKLREIVSRNPNIWMISCNELMFFWDMNHILTVPENQLEACNYQESSLFWRFSNDVFMRGQKPFLIYKDGTEKMQNCLYKASSIDEAASHNRAVYLCSPGGDFYSYHFGWVHSPKKTEGHLLRIAHAQLDSISSGKIGNWSKDFSRLVGASDKEILDWYRTYHKLWTGLFDETVGEHLEEFTGTYPEVIKSHPYFGKTKDEIGWTESW